MPLKKIISDNQEPEITGGQEMAPGLRLYTEACDNERQKSAEALERQRITFNRISRLALKNSSLARVDSDPDEHDDFFVPERNIDGGRAYICKYLDELATAEAIRDIDRSALGVGDDAPASPLKRLGTGLKALGRMALTAVPKAIDSMLPKKWRTVPKIQAIEALKRDREQRIRTAVSACENDLLPIERGHEAIREYVDNFYGDLIVPFNYSDGNALAGFIEECLHDQSSLHYKNVQRIIQSKRQPRWDQMKQELAAIENDQFVQEKTTEIRQSSWLLRRIDELKSKFVVATDQPKKSPPKATESAAKGRKPAAIPTRPPQRRQGGNGGAGDGTGGGTGGSSDRPKRKWLQGLAAAAAVITGTLLLSGGRDNADKTPARQTASAQAPEKMVEPHRDNDKKPLENPLAKTIPEKTATDQKMTGEKKPDNKANKPAPLSRLSTQSQKAKVAVLPKKPQTVDLAPAAQEQNLDKPGEAEIPAQTDKNLLNEEQKLAQLQILEAKINAYKRRIAIISKDTRNYPSDTETGQAIDANLKHIADSLDWIMSQMKQLQSREQIEKIAQKQVSIDRALNLLDQRVVAINVAYGSNYAKSSINLLKETERLAASHGGVFSIEHQDAKQGKNRTYNVDLGKVSQRLTEIHNRLADSQQLSPQEARLLQEDAKYWSGYLKFVNWYLQYNPGKVVKAS